MQSKHACFSCRIRCKKAKLQVAEQFKLVEPNNFWKEQMEEWSLCPISSVQLLHLAAEGHVPKAHSSLKLDGIDSIHHHIFMPILHILIKFNLNLNKFRSIKS